jgi:glycosyltransferase involved in cell wall biosynthesis
VAEHPSSGEIGGAEVAMAFLADRLVKEGIEVHYASRRCIEHQSIQFHQVPGWLARTIQNVVKSYRAFIRTAGSAALQGPSATDPRGQDGAVSSRLRSFFLKMSMRSYESVLSKVDADIYIQVNASYVTGYVAGLCKKKGKPFIFRSTSLWDADLSFTRGFRKWRDDTKMLYLRGVMDADIIAPNSMDTARAFTEYVDKEKVRFMPDGFPLLPCPDLSRKDGYVLWVARDAPYKRAWLYADLARMLPKYQFVMVGNVQRPKSQPSNLHLLGLKEPSELSEIYCKAKVLVSTSEVEGFPNVLVEAGMHGVPYVGFLDPDSAATEHTLGFHVRDLDDMAMKVDTLMSDETLRLRLGRNARRFAEEHCDIDKVIKKWLVLFGQLTQRRP